uniref:Carbonic anhydrase n=1 Tax=Caenorhabditis japonica TaxID=281687 RepID=A0A8R1EBK2_CAEJA
MTKMKYMNYEMNGTIELKNTGRALTGSGFKDWKSKRPRIEAGGLNFTYSLDQFHIHWGLNDSVGSEHAIGSEYYPAELHLVHIREGHDFQSASKLPNGIAVVAVLIEKSHDLIANRFAHIGEEFRKLKHVGNKAKLEKFSPEIMLPWNSEWFYRYEGSMTTPGCEESVIWTVLQKPIAISQDELDLLRELQNEKNVTSRTYRPAQPLNGRRVLAHSEFYYEAYMSGKTSSHASTFLVLVIFFTIFVAV